MAWPSPLVAPVISTVPAVQASGMVITTLPTWRAWLRYRNAAGARRTSNLVAGNGCSTSSPNNPANSSSICWMRSGPASNRSKAR